MRPMQAMPRTRRSMRTRLSYSMHPAPLYVSHSLHFDLKICWHRFNYIAGLGSIKDRVLHCSAVGVPSLHLLRCHGSQSACAASAFGNGIAEHCAFLGSARYLSHGSWCSSCLLRYVSRFEVDLLQLSSPPPPPPPPHLSPPLPHPRTQPYN